MECTLAEHPELAQRRAEVKQVGAHPRLSDSLTHQNALALGSWPTAHTPPPNPARHQGVDRWQLKVQRSADKNFDKFELYVLKNILHVPADLQQVGPPHQSCARKKNSADPQRTGAAE